ncbi:50S ribosomal protein L4 [Candidatus Paracaedibacter symbiosus]|uniref:50S ribosomal protein L4 n=1 Tax=Candidatus Paracaedibacter symbiosus TaxID=244582 RepID=UPI0005094160|nr:50S ribosomal protein L4 [Candidatus Paracaedibacter symbiosus]
MKHNVLDLNAKKTGDIELNPEIFGLEPRVDILSRVIEWQLAKRRAGTHKTKVVAEVRGSGKKIYRQKGTGGARHGSKRQVQFRGGAVSFGPVVRSHAYALPKKVRKLGLKIALSTKLASGELLFINDFNLPSAKAKDLLSVMTKLDIVNTLLIDYEVPADCNVLKASGNIRDFDVLPQIGANVYDIMRKDKVILTVGAVKALEERLR